MLTCILKRIKIQTNTSPILANDLKKIIVASKFPIIFQFYSKEVDHIIFTCWRNI